MENVVQRQDHRDITVVFKNANGNFITALEMQNVAFPYLENAKTRKHYLGKLHAIQQLYGQYQVDFWVSKAHRTHKYEKALSELYEVKITALSFSPDFQVNA
jgi:hypothetical protein